VGVALQRLVLAGWVTRAGTPTRTTTRRSSNRACPSPPPPERSCCGTCAGSPTHRRRCPGRSRGRSRPAWRRSRGAAVQGTATVGDAYVWLAARLTGPSPSARPSRRPRLPRTGRRLRDTGRRVGAASRTTQHDLDSRARATTCASLTVARGCASGGAVPCASRWSGGGRSVERSSPSRPARDGRRGRCCWRAASCVCVPGGRHAR
jgi:hypothetical protein